MIVRLTWSPRLDRVTLSVVRLMREGKAEMVLS